ncbi:ras association domain-containing protein 8 isoform X1 [Triplophysa rosa]|nr:ras association domain-containing protein 8 isoform X1 [Triplophysa rosa]XP_057186299.1 ras association domain-containing protein 8 isoform X1 [Triplophysa rosa]XP_057186300.1 ras association domain-containing protein 8 isoform X1 [Triplophysa rosa]XP_057186301.1 ras association domain-containing protein 8 isoform X1 [Triplophysa rosa]XP_057186303.1 ras association domain-containing protein 8 isoform X1 [Triplophysa rosa]XP_057186304.1 ras association domain-containing protein 8 isoform X1 
MELKVWVDGVVRVVCGLSEETSCQDVVIALAQAIGQTGRYILIQRLRDTERQLLANERPLESLAKLGQHSSEVQFFLRRTGPSSSEEPSPHNHTLPLHKPSTPEAKRGLPKKSFTFNLGPSGTSRTKTKDSRKTPSPEQRASPVPQAAYLPGPSKDEIFRRVHQQQEQLRNLESQLVTVETEYESWERSSSEESTLQEEIDVLEKALWKNQQELEEDQLWEAELKAESERERGMKRRLGELHAKLDDCGQKLHEFNARASQLEKDIQKERLEAETLPGRDDSKDSTEEVKEELESRQKHGEELEAELIELEKALGRAETLLKAKEDDVEELNKELRQCNLQQFIQQAGAPQSRTHLAEHLEQLDLMQEQQDNHINNDSPPRPTAKQFLGHPRNLQNPLVSSLNPEVLTSSESSWQ